MKNNFIPNLKKIIEYISDKENILSLITKFLSFFTIFTFIKFYIKYIPILIKGLPELIRLPTGKIVGSILIMIIGYILFLFKKYQQFWYGTAEAMFALLSCYIAFNLIEGEMGFSTFATIMSTIYVVVRGFNNLSDGYKSPKHYPFKLWIKFFAKKLPIFYKILSLALVMLATIGVNYLSNDKFEYFEYEFYIIIIAVIALPIMFATQIKKYLQ